MAREIFCPECGKPMKYLGKSRRRGNWGHMMVTVEFSCQTTGCKYAREIFWVYAKVYARYFSGGN